MFSFVSSHHTVFQSGFTILHSHQQWMTISVAAHPRQTLVLAIYVPDFGQLNRCIVISHCWLNLHFPDDIWHGTSFYMLIFHFYIFFGELSVKVFDLFLNLNVFLLLTFKSCLFIFGSSTLSVFFKYLLSGCDLISFFSWQCLLQRRNF